MCGREPQNTRLPHPACLSFYVCVSFSLFFSSPRPPLSCPTTQACKDRTVVDSKRPHSAHHEAQGVARLTRLCRVVQVFLSLFFPPPQRAALGSEKKQFLCSVDTGERVSLGKAFPSVNRRKKKGKQNTAWLDDERFPAAATAPRRAQAMRRQGGSCGLPVSAQPAALHQTVAWRRRPAAWASLPENYRPVRSPTAQCVRVLYA